jgi:hypothetical protein
MGKKAWPHRFILANAILLLIVIPERAAGPNPESV